MTANDDKKDGEKWYQSIRMNILCKLLQLLMACDIFDGCKEIKVREVAFRGQSGDGLQSGCGRSLVGMADG